MKRAYSHRHNNLVLASDITYQDCRDDRVTCEICGERAFKVERKSAGGVIHYLSHHRRTSATRECEARINDRMKNEAGRNADDAIGRGQGLRDRVDAMARILTVQFPEAAKYAATVRRKVERHTKKKPTGFTMPEILLSYSAYESMFQIAARTEGINVPDEDVVRYDYTQHWMEHIALMRRHGLDELRRTVCEQGSRQEGWAHDITALICQSQSASALTTLVCHAWADLTIHGAPKGNANHAEAIRRMRLMSDTVIGTGLGNIMEEPVSESAANNGTPCYVLASALLVARMRDILREIDYDAKVPDARKIHPPKHVPIRMHKQNKHENDVNRRTLLSSVGSGSMKMGAGSVGALNFVTR